MIIKYADEHDFMSQCELAAPEVQNADGVLKRLISSLASMFRPRFDPTRLSATEMRERGLTECELDWYRARYGPLIK